MFAVAAWPRWKQSTGSDRSAVEADAVQPDYRVSISRASIFNDSSSVTDLMTVNLTAVLRAYYLDVILCFIRQCRVFLRPLSWRGYRGGSPTTVQAWRPCPLWELSPSHPHSIIVDYGIFCVFCMCACVYCIAVFCVVCFFWVFLTFLAFFPLVLWYCWLGLLICKTVSQITYTVLAETLNPPQSIKPFFLAEPFVDYVYFSVIHSSVVLCKLCALSPIRL